MYGFEKKDQANIHSDDLKVFRKAAKVWLGLSEDQLAMAVKSKIIRELRRPG